MYISPATVQRKPMAPCKSFFYTVGKTLFSPKPPPPGPLRTKVALSAPPSSPPRLTSNTNALSTSKRSAATEPPQSRCRKRAPRPRKGCPARASAPGVSRALRPPPHGLKHAVERPDWFQALLVAWVVELHRTEALVPAPRLRLRADYSARPPRLHRRSARPVIDARRHPRPETASSSSPLRAPRSRSYLNSVAAAALPPFFRTNPHTLLRKSAPPPARARGPRSRRLHFARPSPV
eukprot:CAMPEP_0119272182 /NCGR_PEP_ID=MMETSP1329-20130426/8459_1 /TAXON_ID=114041 /ORGANISM="Genus nov. species nov., Strain RCC1024" /LENGTH=235 /DNA_ID=CAMNT_0007272235 /DNA_START=51 /DNA_END=759 /DNA_ORIENTATION=+